MYRSTRFDDAMPHPYARLLLPAVRWDRARGFAAADDAVAHALDRGVAGFLLFGGEATAVTAWIADVRARAQRPLLIASDLERGAGQQFAGATPLPPAGALGALDDLDVTRRAGELTGREARALGIDWVFAPVADLDVEPANPIVGTRAFGADPARVAAHAHAWIEGARAAGVATCPKHFPGHGRTRGDSHAERPVVGASRAELEADLTPFRAAFAAGAETTMTAHVVYPALDPSGLPATLSPAILQTLLRDELQFRGLVVTDALTMKGLTADELDEGQAAVRALAAGCDVLLYPQDLDAVLAALDAALAGGALPEARLRHALRRVDALTARLTPTAPPPEAPGWGAEADGAWALAIAVRSLRVLRGRPQLPGPRVRLETLDDDVGGPYPPYPRDALPAALQEAGVALADDGAPVLAVFADVRAWKGRPGLTETTRAAAAAFCRAHPDAPVLLFAHPRLADELPEARHLLVAWSGESLMQQAAAAYLTGAPLRLRPSPGLLT